MPDVIFLLPLFGCFLTPKTFSHEARVHGRMDDQVHEERSGSGKRQHVKPPRGGYPKCRFSVSCKLLFSVFYLSTYRIGAERQSSHIVVICKALFLGMCCRLGSVVCSGKRRGGKKRKRPSREYRFGKVSTSLCQDRCQVFFFLPLFFFWSPVFLITMFFVLSYSCPRSAYPVGVRIVVVIEIRR